LPTAISHHSIYAQTLSAQSMSSDETEAFATRLTAAESELIREALEETDLTKSDLLAQGFRYYMDRNPDNISSFRPPEAELCYLEQEGILPPEPRGEWTGINDR
jgi:tRNA U34 5-carboxymethylaminomethyl modifying enzyme MnmG/GidA